MSDYVTIRRAAALTGYTEKEIRLNISAGEWAEHRVWIKAPDRRVLINMRGFREWEEFYFGVEPPDNTGHCSPWNNRQEVLRQRTPAWTDQSATAAIYAECRRLSDETGIPHHVDHELPLLGRYVSGLHVSKNLQILTKSENIRKNNRWTVE